MNRTSEVCGFCQVFENIYLMEAPSEEKQKARKTYLKK